MGDLISIAEQINQAERRADALALALVKERERNLWQAYNRGVFWEGRWEAIHDDCMWLVRELGLDEQTRMFDDTMIRAGIPYAAQRVLDEVKENA